MPSGERKNLVRREVFPGYGGCRPKFGRMVISLFCSVIGVQGLSGDNAEWSFIFFSLSKVLGGCRPKFGRMVTFSCVCLLDAESVFFLLFLRCC